MSFLKIATFTVTIIFGCCSISLSESDPFAKLAECHDKCEKDQKEAIEKGELLCMEIKMNGQEMPEPTTKCGVECRGEKLAEDQNGCLAKFCKLHGVSIQNFCTAPGAGGIKTKEECDTLVGTGKAKLFGEELCNKKE